MTNTTYNHIGVVGGGAWGTALAQTMARGDKQVTMWAYELETVLEINDHHINRNYLPGVELDPAIKATGKFKDLAECDVILLVSPTQSIRHVTTQLCEFVPEGRPVVICAKGIEQSTGRMPADILADTLPQARLAVLSGPSFASEVARGLPAALTLACRNEEIGQALAKALGARWFRVYWTDDIQGVQLGGAIKNVLAIAAGIVDGKEFGASAHAALVARGFAEMARLGVVLGAKAETLNGLSGLGDLILTCGSPTSRNMSLGRALGQGQSLEETLGARRAVTEGVFTAQAVMSVAKKHHVEMPVCEAVHAITSGNLNVDDAITALLDRPMKAET